jgi:hypothetical protein
MDWKSPFIVYRITENGKLQEVFHANDLKDAKYWLSYIAEPGDVLCKTPAHPNYKEQSGLPEYWSHKLHSGQPSRDKSAWDNMAKEKNCDATFPNEQFIDSNK